jgi:uncharacterized protein (TIGR00730 family)
MASNPTERTETTAGAEKARRAQRDNIEASQETVERPVKLRRGDLGKAHELADALIRELGTLDNGDLVGEVVATSLKLLRDNTNRGDMKLIDKSFRELRHALKVFAPYRDTRKVSIFGSARTPSEHPDYQAAEAFGKHMAQSGWMVITGAGGGIMEAGHVGAAAEASFGLNISLPFEQSANEVIHGNPRLVNFKYFFTRKLMFVRSSHAVALFPGGFGTMDEGFEVLTLIQTGKSVPMPLVMVDHPGGDYWKAWDQYIRDHLLTNQLISEEDLHLYKLTDSIEEAAEECRRFYKNYHSLRYTRNSLILRLQRMPTDAQLDEIKTEFADISTDDHWRVGGPLNVERNEPDLRHLARLVFRFNRRSHGRLRQLIDHLNRL